MPPGLLRHMVRASSLRPGLATTGLSSPPYFHVISKCPRTGQFLFFIDNLRRLCYTTPIKKQRSGLFVEFGIVGGFQLIS